MVIDGWSFVRRMAGAVIESFKWLSGLPSETAEGCEG
jgi:hypothetical protein